MKTKSKRIEARVKPDTLVLVQRAAELQGSSVSEFVVSAAEKEARRALEEASTIRLSVEDQRRFVELLLSPPEPTPALERARSAHEALIGCGLVMMCSLAALRAELVDFLPELGPASGSVGQ